MSSELLNNTLNLHCACSVDIRSSLKLLSATWSISSHSAREHAPCSHELIWPRATMLEGSERILSARTRITLGWKNKRYPFCRDPSQV